MSPRGEETGSAGVVAPDGGAAAGGTVPGDGPTGPVSRLPALVRWQAAACAELGSSLYSDLLCRVADDLDAGGVSAEVLRGWEGATREDAVPVRLLGAVHRLVLSGRVPTLAAFYPTTGGDGSREAAGRRWQAFAAALEEHRGPIRAGLSHPPQTNEVGRAAALLGGLLLVLADAAYPASRLPVRLVELGAAAGLNLRADAFRYECEDGWAWGPHGSPVVLSDAWRGRQPAWPLDVVERLGVDLAPLDVADPLTGPDAALTLEAYVWPDQPARFERLRAAIGLARVTPVRLVAASAGDLLDTLELRQGTWTVVWHSVMWQYLDSGEQQRVSERLAQLGAGAAPTRRLLHLSFEPAPGPAATGGPCVVTATCWPGGRQEVLGSGPPHGLPVTWCPPRRRRAVVPS